MQYYSNCKIYYYIQAYCCFLADGNFILARFLFGVFNRVFLDEEGEVEETAGGDF